MSAVTAIISFSIIGLASKQIGAFFSNIRLPYITGYLFAGVLVGPFILGLMEAEAEEHIRFIEEMSLAVIAFVAGSELYLPELRTRVKSIAWNAGAQLIAIFALGSLSVFWLTSYIPFTQDYTTAYRVAFSILTGTILVSRSPAAAVAVIREMRAKGSFTKTTLGITLSMDVLVITLFAITTSLAGILLRGATLNLVFIITLLVNLAADVLLGLLIGRVLRLIMGSKLSGLLKMAWLLLIGYFVFWFAHHLGEYTHEHFPIEISIEPLLPAMVASFYLTNYTGYRAEFAERLERIAPPIYVAFFTVTGLTLKLDILQKTLLIALVLFFIRVVGIVLGTVVGSTLAGESAEHRRIYWLAFISQAGIALGLSREVAVEFPELGDNFATMLVSVVVLNEMIGPIALRQALRISGEARPSDGISGEARHALILGIQNTSITLARQLRIHHWQVSMADVEIPEHATQLQELEITFHQIDSINKTDLTKLMSEEVTVVVSMMAKDSDNYRACNILTDEYPDVRVIARLTDSSWLPEFYDKGVMVVNPMDAQISLLDQFVRTPQSAALFLHRDPSQKLTQITLTDPDINNMRIRDLRLPPEIIILGVNRDGQSIVPHGYTVLKRFDEMTLVGDPEKIDEVTHQLGY